MPKQKSKSASRKTEKTTGDGMLNGQTGHVQHNETTVLLRPDSAISTSDIQRQSSATAARYGPTLGRPSSPVRKTSVTSTSSTTWKLKYQDFLPRPLDSLSADVWKTMESFQ